MSDTRLLLVCCWAVVLLPTPSALWATPLEIVNAGLDAGTADGTPQGWSFEPASEAETPSWKWLPDGGRSGGCVTGGVESPTDNGVWRQDGIVVPEGAGCLRATAWVRSVDVRSSGGVLTLNFTDASDKVLGGDHHVVSVGASRDWTRYVGYVAVPEGAARLSIRLWVSRAFTHCGTFYWDDITLTPVDAPVAPVTRYVDDNPSPTPSAEEEATGFVVFSPNWMRTVFPNSQPRPEERGNHLSLTMAQGEAEPLVVAVHALRPLSDVSVRVTDMVGPEGTICADAVDVRSVSFRTRQGQARWGLFDETVMNRAPLFLEKRSPIPVALGENQPFWLTIQADPKRPAGVYHGEVIVSANDDSEVRLPIAVNVEPVQLPEPDGVMFGMYARMARSDAWLDESFADLRAHGMTGIAVSGDSGVPMSFQDGKPVLAWNGGSPLERNMAACKRHGLMAPALWLMSGEIPRFCETAGPLESDAFGEAYRAVVKQIVAHGKASGWPEIIFQPVDEPFEWEQHLPRNERLLNLLKSVPGVRTEGDGMNGKWENFTPAVYALTDVINLHDGPMLDRHAPVDLASWWGFHGKAKRDGKDLWFYNIDLTAWHPEPVRYMSGFGLWKAKADGVLEWCYMAPVAESSPGQVYEDPAALLYRYPGAPGESGGPTIGYEAVREGTEDYRYLLALRTWCGKAAAHGDAARRLAEHLWRRVEEKLEEANFDGCTGVAMQGGWSGRCEVLEDGCRVVRGDHMIDNGWSFADYADMRRLIVASIQELRKAIEP